MAKMYGSYSNEDLNEWERMPQNIRVLASSAFGAWLLRRDERIKESKAGHWIERELAGDILKGDRKILMCSNCKIGVASGILGFANYCPNCGAKMSEVSE